MLGERYRRCWSGGLLVSRVFARFLRFESQTRSSSFERADLELVFVRFVRCFQPLLRSDVFDCWRFRFTQRPRLSVSFRLHVV